MTEQIKQKGEIPKKWFQFVSVRGGTGVRMGLTKQFERELGDDRGKVLDVMQTIGHFTSNPHPSYPPERIASERAQINKIVQAKTGFTVDEILACADKLERDFNSQPNPIQAGIQSGVSRLLRRSEESK